MPPSTEKSTHLSVRQLSQALVAAAVFAVALAAFPAGAQGTSASGTGSTVSRDDSNMMADLAHTNISEIETGKMALEKSKNQPVRKFAQQMIDDHTAALQELQTLAQSKGVKLPDSPDIQHKTMAITLKVMPSATFDSEYMKRAGVNDHQRAVQLLLKTQKSAKDPGLKALATKMLPTVQHHLEMAQQAVAMTDKK